MRSDWNSASEMVGRFYYGNDPAALKENDEAFAPAAFGLTPCGSRTVFPKSSDRAFTEFACPGATGRYVFFVADSPSGRVG
jgi:hypothetical protein